jgi:hypothetical protein
MRLTRPSSRVAPARLVAFALSLMFTTGTVEAAVKDPPEGLTVDHGRAAQRRGAETLHPLKVDRRPFDAAAGAGRSLDLPSTSQAPQHARFVRSERHGKDFTWIGRVDTELGPQAAVITFGEDATFGTIPQHDGPPLRVETRHGKPWLVEGEAQKRMQAGSRNDAKVPARGDTSAGSAPPSASATATSTSGIPTIDVLVAYTPSLVTYYGSTSAALTRLSYLEALTNQAYADTPANVRIRVVARNLLNYTTAGENEALLDLLTYPSNAVKTQVDAWRQQTGADLVSVVRAFDNATPSDCGIAWIGNYHGQGWDPGWAYSVVSDGEDGGYYCHDQTFAHELGHNMGSQHDNETSGGDYGAYVFSRGYRLTVSSTSGFATVMAYTAKPQTMLNRFSNPAVSQCLGRPCGIANQSDNARSLSNAAASVAAYRAAVTSTPALPVLSIGDASVAEGNSGTRTLTFHVALSAAAPSAVSFHVATANGTAVAGSDYVALSTDASIAAGATGKDISVTINGDTAVEANETFDLVASALSGASLGDASGRGTITNDDSAVATSATLSVADASVQEGNSGTRALTFTVRLSAALAAPVTFTAATANFNATAGSDYVALPATTLTIPAGSTTRTVSVTVNGDTAVEPTEAFDLRVSNVAGATVADGVARGYVINDDGTSTPPPPPPTGGPTLSIADVSTPEGNTATKAMFFTVRLSAAASGPVTYSITSANGTAVAGSDFDAVSLSGQTIPAGSTSKAFWVTLRGDTTAEANETFTLQLGNVAGAAIGDGTAVGTIVNDD